MTNTTTELLDRTIMAVEGNDLAGAVVYWTLHSGASQEDIAEALEKRGLDGEEAPQPPSPKTALRRVMNRVPRQVGRGCLVVREGGVTYVLQDCTDGELAEASAGELLDYRARWGVRLNALSMIEVVGDAPEHLVESIRAEYMRELFTLNTDDVGSWLIDLVQAADALVLRDCGGVYFVPRDTLDDFSECVAALHEASSCRVHMMPAMHSTTAMESILDALNREVEGFVAATSAELASGELGELAIANRGDATKRMLTKVEHFEGLLGTRLGELRSHLTSLEGTAVQAALMSQPDED